MKKFLVIISSIIMLALSIFIVSLCFTKQNDEEKIERDNIIIGVERIPTDLTIEADKNTNNIISALFEGIVKKNNEGQIVEGLCSSYTVSEDGLEYKFKIDEDLKWSNGDKITPREIAIFYISVISDKESEGSKLLSNIYGYNEFIESNDATKLAIGYSKDEIKIRLNKKDDKFLENLSSPKLGICKEYYKIKDIIKNYNKIVTTGPYYIKSINSSEIFLQLNENYKEYNSDLVKEIKLIKGNSQELIYAYYKTEKLDACYNPPISGIKELDSDKVKVLNENNLKYIEISPDVDENTRKKMYYFINNELKKYEKINENKFTVFNERFSNKSLANEDEWISPVFNNNSNSKVLSILGENVDENKQLTEFLKKELSEQLGIILDVTLVSPDKINEELLENKYDLIIDGCKYEKQDGRDLVNKLCTNRLVVDEEKISNNYEEFKSTTDIEMRKENAKSILKVFDENNLFIPLYYSKEVFIINDRIENLQLDYYGNIDYESIKINVDK